MVKVKQIRTFEILPVCLILAHFKDKFFIATGREQFRNHAAPRFYVIFRKSIDLGGLFLISQMAVKNNSEMTGKNNCLKVTVSLGGKVVRIIACYINSTCPGWQGDNALTKTMTIVQSGFCDAIVVSKSAKKTEVVQMQGMETAQIRDGQIVARECLLKMGEKMACKAKGTGRRTSK